MSYLTINSTLLILIGVSIIIGFAVAYNINNDDTDKVKGDKRLVATVFIMSSFIFLGIYWTRQNCREGIRSSLFENFGYYLPDPEKARAAGVKGYDF